MPSDAGSSSLPTPNRVWRRCRWQRRVHLIDRILTPDSVALLAGRSVPVGFPARRVSDKQFVRDPTETLDWDRPPPGPMPPQDIIGRTAAKYRGGNAADGSLSSPPARHNEHRESPLTPPATARIAAARSCALGTFRGLRFQEFDVELNARARKRCVLVRAQGIRQPADPSGRQLVDRPPFGCAVE